MNKKSFKVFFAAAIAFCGFSASCLAAGEKAPAQAAANYREFRWGPGFKVSYPATFDVIDPGQFEGLIPDSIRAERKMKIIFFALNRAGGEPKLVITSSEIDPGAGIPAVVEGFDRDAEIQGGIQKTEILSETETSAETESSALAINGDIFKSRSKIFLIKDKKSGKAVLYQISAGAGFNTFYGNIADIEAIIKSAAMPSGGGKDGGK